MNIRFADIQMLRYELPEWEELSANKKMLIYCLSEATLWGRDITFDQFGQYNLQIRKTLEAIYNALQDDMNDNESFKQLKTYLQRIWFSNGIYHHYSCKKFTPECSKEFFIECFDRIQAEKLPLHEGQSKEELLQTLLPVMFNPEVMPMRVNHNTYEDIIATSHNNFYHAVSQKEAEDFYADMRQKAKAEKTTEEADCLPSFGLNTRLVKNADGTLHEETYCLNGRYGQYIERITYWLREATKYTETAQQKDVINLLIDYYSTGDLKIFDAYSIEWVKQTNTVVDFVNGFIEVYADAIGLKGSWEGIVHYKDTEANRRTEILCQNAQWFEDNSPVNQEYKKKVVKGVTANVVCAAMLGGDEYPSTAIGINLPNADWIRSRYGSKSITISNLTKAYDEASKGSGFREEFVPDSDMRELINKYGHLTDDLHTDLHECLGHGSGQLLPGVDPNALGAYASTIEEARADLFALYYMADEKLVELGLLPDGDAYKPQYYTYLLNGLMTQSVRIPLGENIEEAHMRNRALIARWALSHSDGAIEMKKENGKTVLVVKDYKKVRSLFAELLALIQHAKSHGDIKLAQNLVEEYGIRLDKDLHSEMLERYGKLNIAPYKGFLNPVYEVVRDSNGSITDVRYSITEDYDKQMMRYGTDYSF